MGPGLNCLAGVLPAQSAIFYLVRDTPGSKTDVHLLYRIVEAGKKALFLTALQRHVSCAARPVTHQDTSGSKIHHLFLNCFSYACV